MNASAGTDSASYCQNIERAKNKKFRELFKDKINGSFLINIKSQVMKEIVTDLIKYYDLLWTQEKMETAMVVAGDDSPEYDICRIIVGVHQSHSIFLSTDDIRKNENSADYRDNLKNEIIEKIKLRRYGSSFFRKKPMLLGEEFLFYPVLYELFVLCIRAIELFQTNTLNDINVGLYYTIMINGSATLSLVEDNFLGNAYPLCRCIFETYLKLLVLENYPNIVSYYEKFKNFEIKRSCCINNYPEEFKNLFKERKNKKLNNKLDYLHYGWLDYLEGYHNIAGDSPYSIHGICTFLKNNADEKHKSNLKNIELFYRMCNGYTHGSIQKAKYSLLHYFEISIMLYLTIRDTFVLFCKKLNMNTTINSIDVISMLDRDIKALFKQYDERSTEKFELADKSQ